MTHERDPTALRRDYRYFGTNSYWLLVEDMSEAHAPIMVKEYGRWRPHSTSRHTLPFKRARAMSLENFAKDNVPPWPTVRDKPGKATPSWATGRLGGYEEGMNGGPENQDGDALMSSDGGDDGFIELHVVNDGSDDEDDGALPPPRPVQGGQPLRRTASMHDLGRRNPLDPEKDGEYLAASGNSVSITSNVNSTTSFAQHPLSGGSSLNGGPFIGGGLAAGGSRQLINKRLHRQVLTHRTLARAASTVSGGGDVGSTGHRILRKSKSTNTMRTSSKKLKAHLPTRDEVKKPGYCENCRVKFEEFNPVCFVFLYIAEPCY